MISIISDIIFMVGLYCHVNTVLAMRSINKHFYDVLSDEYFWKYRFSVIYDVPNYLSVVDKIKYIHRTNKIMILADKYYNWINFKNNICKYVTVEDKNIYIQQNEIDTFKKIIKLDFYPNLKFKKDGMALIHRMIKNAKYNIVNILLGNKMFDVNVLDSYGNSCLHYLFKQKTIPVNDLIDLLCSFNNFEFDRINDSHETILHAIFRNLDLRYGYHSCAQTHAKNNYLNSAGHLKLFFFLSERGADVYKRDVKNYLYHEHQYLH